MAQTTSWLRLRHPWVVAIAACGVVIVAIAAAALYGERSGVARLEEDGNHRLELYAATLDVALGKYEYLPGVIALRPEVVALMRAPATTALQDQVNRYLGAANAEAGSAVLYVTDVRGKTLAASNWDEEASFVGMDLSYRPYVRDAMARGKARFYGIGTTSVKPGFYFASVIRDQYEVVGVAVAKVSLDDVEEAWAGSDDIVLVMDASGVVFLSSNARWKFKTIGTLQPAAAAAIEASRQYAGVKLVPLDMQAERNADGARIVTARDERTTRRYLELTHSTLEPSWQLILLSDYAPVEARIRNAVIFAAIALAFLGVLLLYLQQRRRTLRAELATKTALQRANDDLERKVAERTADLSATNERLALEVAERQRAEQVLREAQEGLVQAGKMAALGQMSAGITHELNQPLAAMRTLSDNAQALLAKERDAEVQGNLRMISQLTERMAKLTGQLKVFARKAPLQLGPVRVASAVGHALALVDARLHKAGVELVCNATEGEVRVQADANRLEQVLVNVLVNALDAMEGLPVRRLTVSANESAGRVKIVVADTGPGIAHEALPRLFEPFFTTKEPGAGLGLGLAISAGIVREFGGTLSARNQPHGGAEFTIELKSSRETSSA